MSKAWTGGSPPGWRKLRRLILERDGWLCQLQLEGCAMRANTVHHLDGKRAGDNPTRLVAACARCNGRVGDPTTTDPQPQPLTRWE